MVGAVTPVASEVISLLLVTILHRVVFLFLVILYAMSVSSKHLLIASLSWVEVNVLNQYPGMPSWPGVF